MIPVHSSPTSPEITVAVSNPWISVTAQGDSGEIASTIKIIQYDKVTCLFNTINEDGTLSAISSSEYNHALATWAMELSYAAYNYPDGTELPGIPGDFMGDVVDTAADVLINHGFGNIVENNYTSADCGAHTIAYRDIEYVAQEENTTEEEIITNDNFGIYQTANYGNVHATLYNMASNTGSDGSSVLLEETEENYRIRPLLVVTVRGSVTSSDWDNNFKTQFVPWDNEFADMKDTVAENLSSYIDELETKAESDPNFEFSDPLILITGHSLGAAIANLLAADLSAELGVENVYAYTFATPVPTRVI